MLSTVQSELSKTKQTNAELASLNEALTSQLQEREEKLAATQVRFLLLDMTRLLDVMLPSQRHQCVE
jgi:hypothetical protein